MSGQAADGAPQAPRVRFAQASDLDALGALFDAYRQFYELPADAALSRRYIAERLAQGQASVLVAPVEGVAVEGGSASEGLGGFCLLYPSFCSLEAAPIRVLNDLYVRPEYRGRGLAQALMQAAEDSARQAGCARLDLSTAHTNHTAQALYESRGWQLDRVFRYYSLKL